MDKTLLFDLAEDIQQAITTAFAAASVDLPARQYIADGSVAEDCGQFTIEFTQLFAGSSGAQQVGPARFPIVIFTAEFNVQIIRCVPTMEEGTGRAPSPADLIAAAKQMLTDAWVLWNGIVTGHESGPLQKCSNISLGPLTPIGPDGGLGGVTLKIGVQV
jgi:hypothetical protein